MNLTPEQIVQLAELDRQMDSGAQPFVRDASGQRWAFSAEVLQACGCVSGQTASHAVIQALMETNLARMTVELARRKAQENGLG